GYNGARSALIVAGARIVPVRVDDQGLDVAAAVKQSPDARLAYVTPSNQFPLGVPMSLSRRLALLKWASAVGAWIVEGGYDGEFRYGTCPLQSLYGLDADGRVICLGTFAKSMFPALRLGFLVVPPDLRDQFRAARRLGGSSTVTRANNAHRLHRRRLYGRHIRRMRRNLSRARRRGDRCRRRAVRLRAPDAKSTDRVACSGGLAGRRRELRLRGGSRTEHRSVPARYVFHEPSEARRFGHGLCVDRRGGMEKLASSIEAAVRS